MQKYNGQLIRQFASSITGNAASGVTVTVRKQSDASLATLYVENNIAGATLPNPLTTTDKGFFAFYAADGVYTLTFSDSTPQQVIQLQDVAELQTQFDAAVLNAGYIPSGAFTAGATLTQANQVLSDGSSYWRWDGSFPKVVTAGSSPTPTGVGGWFVVSDFALRGDLAATDSTVLIAGVESKNTVTHGSVRLQNPSSGNSAGQKHMVVRTLDANQPTNVHQEPNGFVDQGTVTKYDWMIDPFDIDQVNYRLGNIYTKTGVGTGAGFNGQNGVVVFGAKSEGDYFGLWPSINIGFSDDNANGVPLKVMYFDTSDTAWRTPFLGRWRASRSVTTGDHILANFKLYQAQNTGTTGSTKPNHSSGAVSDGAINWFFIRDFSASAGSIKPAVLIGDRNDMPKFGFPNVRAQFAKDSLYWNGVKQVWANNSNAAGITVAMDSFTDDWKFNFSGGGYLRHSASNNFVQSVGLGRLMVEQSITTGTTIDVRATELVLLSYAATTTITAFTGRPNQRIYVHATNANVTLQHGANIKLAGGVSRVMSADAMLCFVFNSGGTVAKQVIS